MENCTRCGAELDDLKINLKLSISVNRLSESGLWEDIPNSILDPQETLCQNCFSEFTDVLDKALSKTKKEM